MNDNPMTWAETVTWLRTQPSQQELVRACYYDDPLTAAAKRYASSAEWESVRRRLPSTPGIALEVGAGRGIVAYALCKEGWTVRALEPDASPIVGTTAIRQLSLHNESAIGIIRGKAEALPFRCCSFDLAVTRAVLHHAGNLGCFCSEIARILKPGGLFIAIREHVLSRPGDLKVFLEQHPLHKLYGGENALLLSAYHQAFRTAGLTLKEQAGPFQSWLNLTPQEGVPTKTSARLRTICRRYLAREQASLARIPLNAAAALLTHLDSTPGRLYSFVLVKPA
jgi:SAM-dependent methyltransferase